MRQVENPGGQCKADPKVFGGSELRTLCYIRKKLIGYHAEFYIFGGFYLMFTVQQFFNLSLPQLNFTSAAESSRNTHDSAYGREPDMVGFWDSFMSEVDSYHIDAPYLE